MNIRPATSPGGLRPLVTLPILNHGSCEPFKAVVHGAALGLAAIMGLYNAAAWLRRGDRHLAVNTVVYAALTVWETRHVRRHLAIWQPAVPAAPAPPADATEAADRRVA